MNKIKSLCLMVLLVVSMLAVSGISNAALDVSDVVVKVEGVKVYDGGSADIPGLEKNDEIDVKVEFTANADFDDVQVEAQLRGYDHNDLVEDITDGFDVHAGRTYIRKLTLNLPQRMDKDRQYQLKVLISDRYDYYIATATLDVSAAEHELQIRDIILSPENTVKAGRALLASVRVKNRGESEEEDLKIKVSLPELGISASDYIDELDEDGADDDSTTSDELYLRIPDCAEAGEYTVKACVEYDDGDEEECETTTIEVVEGDICAATVASVSQPESKTIITIGPETQDITAGQSAAYSVTLANQGTESKSYTVAADGSSFATMSITPTNVVVLSPGESKSVFVNVAPSAGASDGEQMFSVTISSNDKVLKEVPLKANVVKAGSGLTSMKKVLEIGLVVLVVLLVILGLIIGFNKLKGSDELEDKEEQTYY